MECFAHLTHLLVAASTLNNPTEAESERKRRGVILALEGGYNLTATAEALSHCVATLLADTCLRLSSGLAPTDKWVSSAPCIPIPQFVFAFCSHRYFLPTLPATVRPSPGTPRRLCKYTVANLVFSLFPARTRLASCIPMHYPIYITRIYFSEVQRPFAKLLKFKRTTGHLCLITVSCLLN